MLPFPAAALHRPAPGKPPNKTSRSAAAPRAHLARYSSSTKEPNPEPSRPFLLRRVSALSLRQWLARCHCHLAVAAAAAALVLVICALPPVPARAARNGEGLKPKGPYPCEDVGRYYGGLDGLAGDELMVKLGAIVSPHASLRYKDVWDALKILDAADAEHPDVSSEVIEIYTQRAVPKMLAGKPDGWNREHLWPRSYGLTYGPSLTDLHNIRPADVNVNSSRGNKYYGECASISIRCVRPANHEAAPDTETDGERWAPPFQVRGDVARSLMYMAVSYGSGQKDGAPHLELSDSPSIQSRNMGLLSALVHWNELDPPSRSEQLRNDRVCSLYQHNRNPFVDHPEYANLIWKNITAKSPNLVRNPPKAWINEQRYENQGKDKNEFVELLIHTSLDVKDLMLVLCNGANRQMYDSLSLGDKEAFDVTKSNSGYLMYTTFNTLQNGPADGIALVYGIGGTETVVLDFISYEGRLSAVDGPAKGIVSVDVMLKETDESSMQDSLGLAGSKIGEFAWRKLTGHATPGKLNIGQMF